MVTSFKAYSQSDSRATVTKVLKYSGGNFNIRKRGDVGRQAVFFKPMNSTVNYAINDEKPKEITQRFEAIIFLDQADNHSAKASVYDRALEIADIVTDWTLDTSADTISSDTWTLTYTGGGIIDEQDGYLSTTVTFQSIIKIQ